jgi:hypothetical protein
VPLFGGRRPGRLGILAGFDALRRPRASRRRSRAARPASAARNTGRFFLPAARAAVARALLFAHVATDRWTAREFRRAIPARGDKPEFSLPGTKPVMLGIRNFFSRQMAGARAKARRSVARLFAAHKWRRLRDPAQLDPPILHRRGDDERSRADFE